ncbi:hypothetical protein CDAR_591381 [Caerostris darwini]|uniref:Uncharacterized protein n=1 Tax=Caerostris darwini TaxID=1538125 RepID=A0AAV4QU74_9ARAC|nr:hypothetical protein CDAR_591381 [Caerostris darwini]
MTAPLEHRDRASSEEQTAAGIKLWRCGFLLGARWSTSFAFRSKYRALFLTAMISLLSLLLYARGGFYGEECLGGLWFLIQMNVTLL